MGIKLVKNFEEGRYGVMNKEFLLQMIDNNRQLEGFSGRDYYVFNPVTNEHFEIMPEVVKYDFAKYFFVRRERNYTLITSGRQINEHDIEIQFYRYNIADNSSVMFYKRVVNLAALNESLFIKVFVLPEDYCLIEFIDILNKDNKYEFILKSYNSKKEMKVNNKLLCRYGLDKMLPLNGNNCAIKIGDELIGIININWFISDMIIGLENIYVDVLDQGNGQFELPFMRRYGNNLTYIKKDISAGSEEIVIYDYENKLKKIRFNSSIENIDLKKLWVINNTPYYFDVTDNGVSIINLNTQKNEAEISGALSVKYVVGDLIVVSKTVKRRLSFLKNKELVQVFRMSDTKQPVYTVRGQFSCCVEHFDDLLIFIR